MSALAVGLMVAAFVAGNPAGIACDVPSTAVVDGYTTPSTSNVIHMKQIRCDGLGARIGTREFANSITLVIHESSHLGGVRSEACAELWANVAVYEVLFRYYAIPLVTELSELVGEQLARLTRTQRCPQRSARAPAPSARWAASWARAIALLTPRLASSSWADSREAAHGLERDGFAFLHARLEVTRVCDLKRLP